MLHLNGRLLVPKNAGIDPQDRGFLLGDGLFETMLAQAGRIVLIEDHLARLEAGAKALGIPLPHARDALAGACAEVLEANRLSATSAALRLTLSRGPGPRGLAPPNEPTPTLLIAAAPIADTEPLPARAITSAIRRNEHSPLAGLKSLNYLDNILALREAREKGADEAILRNTAGRLACASAANLFLVRGERLLTPPLNEGVLPGVTRGALLGIARALGLAVEETDLPPDALGRAEEAFLTNSIVGIRPLVEIDSRAIKDGRIGPMTLRLRKVYGSELRRAW